MRYLYPRMTAIHDLSPNVGFPSEKTGRLILPSPMPSSYTHMEPHGVYMIGELSRVLEFLLIRLKK
jgi:protein transport protein SEC24